MTHDPLCPYRPQKAIDHGAWDAGQPCYCDFITRVRLDEADKAFRTGYQRGYLDALNIRPPLHPCVESPVWAGQPNSPTQSETRS